MIFQKGNIPDAFGSAPWGMDPKAIKALLREAGKNQADLARHMGWKESTVSKLLNGGRQLKAQEADRIGKFLGSKAAPYENASNMDVRRVDTPPEIPTRI